MIEIIMVVVLASLILSVSVPVFIRWRDSAKIKGVASDVLSGLRHARSLAIANNEEIDTMLDPGAHELSYDGRIVQLEESVNLETGVDTDTNGVIDDDEWDSATTVSTTFRPNGSCTALVNIRVNNNDDLIITIDSIASGLARL